MADEDNKNFESALAQVMRPLARSMIGQGVTIAQATEIMKQAYVSAALEVETGTPTDSRISLLTGIHRKDVKRLRESDPRPPRRPMQNAAAVAVSVWRNDPDFLDADGNPLALSRSGEPGFDELIKQARIDLPASVVLDALKEQGLMTEAGGSGLYKLTSNDFTTAKDLAAKVMAFEKNLSSHLEAAADNLVSKEGVHFERAAHFNQLSEASIAKLEREASQKLQSVLVEINTLAMKLQDEDALTDHNGRFSVGGYSRGKANKHGGQSDT